MPATAGLVALLTLPAYVFLRLIYPNQRRRAPCLTIMILGSLPLFGLKAALEWRFGVHTLQTLFTLDSRAREG